MTQRCSAHRCTSSPTVQLPPCPLPSPSPSPSFVQSSMTTSSSASRRRAPPIVTRTAQGADAANERVDCDMPNPDAEHSAWPIANDCMTINGKRKGSNGKRVLQRAKKRPTEAHTQSHCHCHSLSEDSQRPKRERFRRKRKGSQRETCFPVESLGTHSCHC
jgi:hypothetical protein